MYEKITLYYSKSTGKIKNFATGIHDMRFYGDDIDDYSKIYDFIVVDYDKFIENNFNNFTVINGSLVFNYSNINFFKNIKEA